ncbi:MAG: sensor histidine kinase, partial [Pseudomonadota bacterium]
FEQTDTDKSIRASTDACLQIIINIVDNAIKFSRNAERKEVLIRSKILNNGSFEIGIRDYGPGIEQSQMKKIFELFYRSENELTRETVGTGIGLALVHELATNMGAQIDVRHCDPGVEFTINWPRQLVINQANAQ